MPEPRSYSIYRLARSNVSKRAIGKAAQRLWHTPAAAGLARAACPNVRAPVFCSSRAPVCSLQRSSPTRKTDRARRILSQPRDPSAVCSAATASPRPANAARPLIASAVCAPLAKENWCNSKAPRMTGSKVAVLISALSACRMMPAAKSSPPNSSLLKRPRAISSCSKPYSADSAFPWPSTVIAAASLSATMTTRRERRIGLITPAPTIRTRTRSTRHHLHCGPESTSQGSYRTPVGRPAGSPRQRNPLGRCLRSRLGQSRAAPFRFQLQPPLCSRPAGDRQSLAPSSGKSRTYLLLYTGTHRQQRQRGAMGRPAAADPAPSAPLQLRWRESSDLRSPQWPCLALLRRYTPETRSALKNRNVQL